MDLAEATSRGLSGIETLPAKEPASKNSWQNYELKVSFIEAN